MNKVEVNATQGWLNGLIGVILFSGSLPATRVAVLELDPVFLTACRASIAGIFAFSALVIFNAKRPNRQQFSSLAIVGIGVVAGFPLLSALALRYITSAHSIVSIGILPVSTAVFGIIRGGERPKPIFWIFSLVGSLLVIGYAMAQGATASPVGSILMFGAVVLCGLGYAEGAKLTKFLGGWQVISWALALSFPVMLPLAFIYMPSSFEGVSSEAWIGLSYVSLFSMFIGFIFWYRGLAQGGTATVGQLQLLQPFFGLALASLLLHENVNTGMIFITIAVILCVVGTKKFAK
ncbi:EamA/RhaT family transporter [Terrimonas sp.]|uniref:DMT family transporter n=1 Tax=Terrimonas sp. TaxID=1914338 RepID=UPI000D51AF77|nr:DMT family transporter [Terrimonas sp.]PVD52267.1 EamA/RhaT family transporter [Terrimonas sp.]